MLHNSIATPIAHSVKQIPKTPRKAYQIIANLIAAYRNLIENDCLYGSFPFHVEIHLLSLAKTTSFGIISHVIKLMVSWNPKFGIFDDGPSKVTFVEDCIDEAENCLLDSDAVIVIVTIFTTGDTVNSKYITILIIEKIYMTVFANIEKPFRTTHRIIKTKI